MFNSFWKKKVKSSILYLHLKLVFKSAIFLSYWVTETSGLTKPDSHCSYSNPFSLTNMNCFKHFNFLLLAPYARKILTKWLWFAVLGSNVTNFGLVKNKHLTLILHILVHLVVEIIIPLVAWSEALASSVHSSICSNIDKRLWEKSLSIQLCLPLLANDQLIFRRGMVPFLKERNSWS